jgi:hypothetical protein
MELPQRGMHSLHADDEAHRLVQLLDACHRVLAHISDRDDWLAIAIRDTCEEAEKRLNDLGVPYMDIA